MVRSFELGVLVLPSHFLKQDPVTGAALVPKFRLAYQRSVLEARLGLAATTALASTGTAAGAGAASDATARVNALGPAGL